MKVMQPRSVRILSLVLIIFMLIITLLPLCLMLINSLKTRMEITRNPLALPVVPVFSNYVQAWIQGSVPQSAANSLILVAGTITLTLIISCMAAYALAHKMIIGWQLLAVYFLICNTIPKQLFIIPLFFMLQKTGMVNNLIPMIVVYSALYSPFAIFLLRTYFQAISPDFIHSAMIDGATQWQIFWKIVLPLVQPGMLTAALIIGLWCWNEFLFSVTFLHDESLTTLAVRFYGFTSRYVTEWGNMMAFAVFVSVPVIIFFVFLQKRFIDGMTSGGVKG